MTALAKITVDTPAAVMYDGRPLYQSDTEHAVNDTYANVELYCYWYPISEDGAVVAAE